MINLYQMEHELSKKKDNEPINMYRMTRVEIIGRLINGKQIYFITDCDKSFCNECAKESCTLEYFLEKNPEKGKLFLNEVYKFVIEKNPSLADKFTDKKDLITFILKKCSGYDNCYDFLFKGEKLISIKYDDLVNLKKND